MGLFAQSTKRNHHSSGSKRRSGHGTLDPADITEFLARNGQLILPFLQNQGMTTSSDEDYTSKKSMKIKGSCLDIVLKHDRTCDDDSDHNHHNHRNGPKIEEIHDQNEEPTKYTKRQSKTYEAAQKSHDSNHNHRPSRNSTRSKHSRKSQALTASLHKRSLKRNRSSKTPTSAKRRSHSSKIFDKSLLNSIDLNAQLKRELSFGKHNDDSASDDSFSSEDLDLPLNVFLNHSMSGKSSSHSKTSCDVGIQADAFDMSNQTSMEDELHLKKCVKKLNRHNHRKSSYNDNEDDAMEMHTLLGGKQKDISPVPLIMSETEKLKMLLLPSN